jgi:hypothetical protein
MTGFESKRNAAKAKMNDDDDTQVYDETLTVVYQRGFADGKAAANAMHDLARLGQEIEQEPCVGKDPRCPCQDGDACHYKDCGNTKARPVAQRTWVGLTDEDVNRESAMIASKMKLAFHAGMYVAQNILEERNT